MSCISFIEKQTINRLFGIQNGYIFSFAQGHGYTETTSKNIILESCGINIFEDEEFKGLSQQKCFEKICNEKDSNLVAKLLKGFSEYFCFYMGDGFWSDEESRDYWTVQKIIEKLTNEGSVNLDVNVEEDLQKFIEDIKLKMLSGNPEMALDRLHTFSTKYLRMICQKHGVDIDDGKGNFYPLHSLVGNLKKWYKKEEYFESEFCEVAIQNSINVFDKFNSIRNDHSAAHPNKILNEIEADYVVRIVSDTLTFIDKIESTKQQQEETLQYIGDDLPF